MFKNKKRKEMAGKLCENNCQKMKKPSKRFYQNVPKSGSAGRDSGSGHTPHFA